MICEDYEKGSRGLNHAIKTLEYGIEEPGPRPITIAYVSVIRIRDALASLEDTRWYLDKILKPRSFNPYYQGRKDPVPSPLGYCQVCGFIWGVCMDCEWTEKDCECDSFKECCRYYYAVKSSQK